MLFVHFHYKIFLNFYGIVTVSVTVIVYENFMFIYYHYIYAKSTKIAMNMADDIMVFITLNSPSINKYAVPEFFPPAWPEVFYIN